MNVDEKFGKEKEIEFLDVLRRKYGEGIVHIQDRFSPFDYISETHLFELKARRNTKHKYPSVMVGYNKLLSAQMQENKIVVFCFDFVDAKCYYEYNPDDKDKIQIRVGGRSDRGKEEFKLYAYIPVELLQDF